MPTGERPPTPHNIVRLAVSGDIGGRPFANVYHVETDEPGIQTAAGVQDMCNAFHAALEGAGIIQRFSTALHVTQIHGVVQLSADTALSSIIAFSLLGTSTSAQEIASTSVVLSWLTNVYWRGGKPRTYIPGVTAGMLSDNHSLLDSEKAAILASARNFRSAVNAITTPAVDKTTFGFVSYASGKLWRPTPLFFPFNDVIIHDRVGSQRRRLGPWLT